MNKTNKILIILIVLIIVIISAILYIILGNNNYQNDYSNINMQEITEKVEVVQPQKVTNPHMYLTVKSCVEKYLGYIYIEDAESVYRILDSKYIQKFNISQENVFEYVEDIPYTVSLSVDDMYVIEKNETEHEYYISGGLIREYVDETIPLEGKYIVTVKLDTENMIYSIIPYGYGGPLYEEK